MRTLRLLCVAALLPALAACGGASSGASSAPLPAPAPVPGERALLFYGNSHTHFNELPALVAELFRQASPGQPVRVAVAPGLLFLDERLSDTASRTLLDSAAWSQVFLQAQKYSSSGTVNYSTEEAKAWIRLVKARGATPVLFPEWPRQGVDESARIYGLHEGIAKAEAACLAPVPQAFDRASAALPALALHAADGNHSSPAGALLAAYVLYASASGQALGSGPALVTSPVAPALQAQLRQLAAQSLAAGPAARAYCP
ncbi:MAG: hypothetical protein U1E77_01580 [Inhella sp.]